MTDQHEHGEPSEAAKIIGPKWGVSLVVVIAMLTAAVANVRMMSSTAERTASLEGKIEGTVKTLDEIKKAVTELTGSMQREISILQRENADIRERLAREVGELRVQIAELKNR
jgi:TolA-binding protein